MELMNQTHTCNNGLIVCLVKHEVKGVDWFYVLVYDESDILIEHVEFEDLVDAKLYFEKAKEL